MNTVTGYKVEGKILTNEEGPTLGQVLSTLARVCKSTEGSFTTEDILHQCEYSRGNGQELNQNQTHSLNVRWLFDQLVEAGWLYNSDTLLASSRVLSGSDSRGGYRCAVKGSSSFRLECLAVPADPPHGADQYGLNYRRSAVMEALKVSLEVGDDNQVNRMMAGLIGSDAPGGTALRARVLDGRGPQWLMALLQEYALNVLEWRPDHGWPSWLLPKSKRRIP